MKWSPSDESRIQQALFEEISITIDGKRVLGLLEAAPNSITVEIQSFYKSLKAVTHTTGFGMGQHRSILKGKVVPSAIQDGKEILKGLYLAGQYLQSHPEFITRLRRYLSRFEKCTLAIQKERKELLEKLGRGEVTRKTYEARCSELLQAEHQNVIERNVIFRRYEAELTLQSGGRADIGSVRDFTLIE